MTGIVVEVLCEICGLSARMSPPDDIAFMAAHEEWHRARGDLPRATDLERALPAPRRSDK